MSRWQPTETRIVVERYSVVPDMVQLQALIPRHTVAAIYAYAHRLKLVRPRRARRM